jgi:hypothetical protein
MRYLTGPRVPLAAERQRRANFWHANVSPLSTAMNKHILMVLDDPLYYALALAFVCLLSFGLGLVIGLAMIATL